MRVCLPRLCVMACVTGAAGVVAGSAGAMVPNTGPDTHYQWVGVTGGGSGTAIARRSVITARHVTGLTYSSQGTTYTATTRIAHPTMDLAILNFDVDLPGWHTFGGAAPLGAALTMVGCGRTGVLNASGTGYQVDWAGGWGTRIAGTNTIEEKWEMTGLGPSLVAYLGANGEGVGASSDSGGAFFVGDRLVGVIAYVFNASGGTKPDYGFASINGGVPYFGTGAIDLTNPGVRSWVLDNIVPAPGAAMVVLVGVVGAVRRRGRGEREMADCK